jgi:hypothetical protein
MGNFYLSTAADVYQAVNAITIILAPIPTIPYPFQFTCKGVIARIKSAAPNSLMEIK